MGAVVSDDTAGNASGGRADETKAAPVAGHVISDPLQEPLLSSTEESKASAAPLPVLREPGEAQREPCDWPLPRSLTAATVAGESEWRVTRCCRSTFRVIGTLLLLAGLALILFGVIHGYWKHIHHWVVTHAFQFGGFCLGAVGVFLRFALQAPRPAGSERPAWDDPALGDDTIKNAPLFQFKIWNDTARFRTDAESLDDLFNGRSIGGESSRESLLRTDPVLSALVQKSENAESEQRKNRSTMAKHALIERCKEELEGGISARRLQQSLEPRCFVLDFVDDPNSVDSSIPNKGNLKTTVRFLRDAVSFLLVVCSPYDEVIIRVTSPGGLVSDYGLASSQLLRFREAGVRLTACIDTVAASGGYMMACVADLIVAAPFALVGSIGVVAGLPNFHRVMKRHEVDYLLFTAGRFKRTVDVFTENSEEGIAKFQEELNTVHSAFTAHVEQGRGTKIQGGAISAATGEAFLASEAHAKGLVDELGTSDEYLRRRAAEGALVIEIRPFSLKRGCLQELMDPVIGNSISLLARFQGLLVGAVSGVKAAATLHPGLIGATFPEALLTKAEVREPMLQS